MSKCRSKVLSWVIQQRLSPFYIPDLEATTLSDTENTNTYLTLLPENHNKYSWSPRQTNSPVTRPSVVQNVISYL